MILLHKKGNTSGIENYRPISLLPSIYKVFSCILLQWILQTLDFHQPREWAGFRAGFSMIDHYHVINQLQEKAHEYNITLCFPFMDYEKAFDSIEFEPIFHAIKNHGVDKAYLDIIKHLYHEATSVTHLHTDSKKFRLQRGVRPVTTYHLDSSHHVYKMLSLARSTGKTEVSRSMVNTYPTSSLHMP